MHKTPKLLTEHQTPFPKHQNLHKGTKKSPKSRQKSSHKPLGKKALTKHQIQSQSTKIKEPQATKNPATKYQNLSRNRKKAQNYTALKRGHKPPVTSYQNPSRNHKKSATKYQKSVHRAPKTFIKDQNLCTKHQKPSQSTKICPQRTQICPQSHKAPKKEPQTIKYNQNPSRN